MPKKSTVRTQPNNIDTLCKAQKKTQREIAQKINFTEGYIAMVKRGKVSCVSMEFVEKLDTDEPLDKAYDHTFGEF